MYASKCTVYKNIEIIYTFLICFFQAQQQTISDIAYKIKKIKIKLTCFSFKNCLVLYDTHNILYKFVFMVSICYYETIVKNLSYLSFLKINFEIFTYGPYFF